MKRQADHGPVPAAVASLLVQVLHALVEVCLDRRPGLDQQEDQNRQGDGADDQDRLQTDRAVFILVNLLQKFQQGIVFHGLSLHMNGLEDTRTHTDFIRQANDLGANDRNL